MKSISEGSDKKFISYALNLSKKNLGQTAPNPVVGCVIVKNGEIISSGITAKNGRPHAEKIAIEKVTDKKLLEGATIYITLEPCSHFGQTSPCVDEIIKNKFAKVVIATQDFDQRVNGNGIKKLQEARIDVVLGVLENEAREINRGFFKAKKTAMPFVTLKVATSLDGKIATKNFDSKWITSPRARLFSHHLRSINDAILIGAGTLKHDNPSLDCRINGLEDFSPKRIVISNNLDLDLSAKIFQDTQKIPTIILTKNSVKTKLEEKVPVILCQEKDGAIDLEDALKKLCALGINSLLIEGGQRTTTEFLKANLVDELVWIRNKKIIGSDGISALGEMNVTRIAHAINNFHKVETKEFEEDSIEIYRNNSR